MTKKTAYQPMPHSFPYSAVGKQPVTRLIRPKINAAIAISMPLSVIFSIGYR